jgi:hypothetical protein
MAPPPLSMVFPTVDPQPLSTVTADVVPATDIESPAFDRPLRVGVLLDSLTVPRWVAKILEDIAGAPFATLSLVVVDATDDPPVPATWREWFARQRAAAPYRLWEWYQAADYRRFRGEDADPFEPTDVTPLVQDANVLRVKPLRLRFVDRFRPEDVQQVREAGLDVLLRFGFRIVKGEILGAATCGMWSLHHDDNRSYRGGPALFWEIYERNPESGTILQVLTDALDGGKVLYRSIGATNLASVYKNRRATYWKSAEFMMRRLADLHRDGWASLQQLDTYNEPNAYERGIYRRPTNGQMVRFLAKTCGYRLKQNVLSRLEEQWVIAFRRRGSNDRFTLVDPPADRFYADPFLAEQDGRTFVFFEDYSYSDGKGAIACAELRPSGIGETRTVLAGPDHLSYPSLFQWRGEWFMVPETGARRRVEIWRARRFPGDWALETVALDGVDACDATVCEHDGRWWMFVTLCVAGGPRADEVSLFYADTPLGPWRAHRASPVVSDVSHARSAGALYRVGDVLYRPSQDARGGYGRAITLSRIDRMTTREYHETPTGSIAPTWHPRVRGTHTIARSSMFEVVDGRLLRFRRRAEKDGRIRRTDS